MKIPSIFRGTHVDVKRDMRKLVTRLRRGEKAVEILSGLELVDVEGHPDALLWIGRASSMIGGQQHFVLLALGEAIFRDTRLSYAEANRVRDGLVEYLSLSAWGTIALNAQQSYRWIQEAPDVPRRNGFAAVLEGTCRFWDDYIALGRRFFAGGAGASTFPETLPLVGFVLANSGHDPRQYVETVPHHPGGSSWGDIKRICAEHDVVRLVRDDDRFWEEVVRRYREHHGKAWVPSTEGT